MLRSVLIVLIIIFIFKKNHDFDLFYNYGIWQNIIILIITLFCSYFMNAKAVLKAVFTAVTVNFLAFWSCKFCHMNGCNWRIRILLRFSTLFYIWRPWWYTSLAFATLQKGWIFMECLDQKFPFMQYFRFLKINALRTAIYQKLMQSSSVIVQ